MPSEFPTPEFLKARASFLKSIQREDLIEIPARPIFAESDLRERSNLLDFYAEHPDAEREAFAAAEAAA